MDALHATVAELQSQVGKLSESVEWGVAKIEALESEVVSLRGELARVAAGRPTGASGVVVDPQPPAPMSSSAPALTPGASTLSETPPPTSDAQPRRLYSPRTRTG